MISKSIKINITSGIEARPVALLVQVASQYESEIHVECGNKTINAKSIMGMMSLGMMAGEELLVRVNGSDEAAAMNHIEQYLTGEAN